MKRLLLSCIILVIAFFIFSGQAFAADVDGSNWMSCLPSPGMC